MVSVCSAARGRLARTGRAAWSGGLAASSFDCLVGEETKKRHHDRRYPASFTNATISVGLVATARTILHAIEDIDQSHILLL